MKRTPGWTAADGSFHRNRRDCKKADAAGLVHHSKCMGATPCRCPFSWPRLPEDVGLTHRRSGNCWLPSSLLDIHPHLRVRCNRHLQPRGACSECGRCPACDLYGGGLPA